VVVVRRRRRLSAVRLCVTYTRFMVITVYAWLQTWFGGEPGRGHGQGRPSSPELGVGEGLRARHLPGDVPART